MGSDDFPAAEVASSYFNAVIDGDYETAAQWVVGRYRGVVQALGLGSSAGQAEVTGDVSVGNLQLTGDTPAGATATVTFVGRMCRTPPSSEAAPSPQQECIDNDDPHTKLPYFIIHMVQTVDDGWRVTFPVPSQG